MLRVASVDSVYDEAPLGGGAGDGQLPLRVGDPGEAGGGQRQRRRDRPAEEGGREVDLGDVAQHAGRQLHVAEGGRVRGRS